MKSFVLRIFESTRVILNAFSSFATSINGNVQEKTSEFDRKPMDSYFSEYANLSPADKQYLDSHLKRWLMTLTLGSGFFEQLSPSSKVLSLASDGNFERLVSSNFPDIRHIYSDWDLRHKFPLKDSDFDGVTCLEVLEHLKDPDSSELDFISTHYLLGFFNTLLEVNRILKDGGLAIFTTPNTSSYNSIVSILRGESHYFYWPHVREFAPFELNFYFQKCGFEVLNLSAFSPYEHLARFSKFKVGLIESLASLFDASPKMNELRGSTLFYLVRKIGPADEILLDSGFRLITSDFVRDRCV